MFKNYCFDIKKKMLTLNLRGPRGLKVSEADIYLVKQNQVKIMKLPSYYIVRGF